MIFCLLCEKKLDKFEIIHKTVRGDTSNTSVVKCEKCGHVQLNKSFNNLKEHYESDSQYREIKKTFKKTDKQTHQSRYAFTNGLIQRLEHVYKVPICENTKVMDFGSGTQILALLLNSQYNCFIDSVEISKTIINDGLKNYENIYKNCNNKLKILNITLDDNFVKTHKNRYNIITMIHVLEHLDNLSMVKNLYELLNHKGKLIIETPNHDDIMFKIGGNNYKNIKYQIHHISYLYEETYKKLFKKLDINNYTMYYYHLYNLKNFVGFVLNNPIPSCISDPSTSDDDLQNFWLNSMIKNKCTDSMAVVIEKD